ncbi:MAG: hypothetical protein M3Y74_10705 [Chloroflexota bacterium]|nr:hypothetical protein [Chloroflexota bacterium]
MCTPSSDEVCSDPIVILSDGIALDVSATIADDASDVKQITYVLHVPDGAAVIRAISTDGAVGYKEKFTVQSGSAPGVYTTEVQIKTGVKNVAVMATVAGGYATQLGITPDMVGLASFAWTPTTAVDTTAPPTPKGPTAPATLPGTTTDALVTWAESAAWSASTSTQGLAGAHIVAAVTL